MIERLKIKSKEETLAELNSSEMGSTFAQLFGGMVQPQPPTDIEMMNKINEIIDHLNKKEKEDVATD